MCGIGTISTAPDSDLDVRRLTRGLLHSLTTRGRDAAGVAWKRQDGTTLYRKAPGHPLALAGRLAIVEGSRSLDTAGAVLVHTRYATIGTPADNDNNHPLVRTGVVMVHNGQVRNAPHLYRLAGRKPAAAVDSDALAAVIETADTTDELDRRLEQFDGVAAIGWFDVTDDPADSRTVHLARIDTRPLTWARTRGGDFIAASTEFALRRAAELSNLVIGNVHHVAEGTVLTVDEGRIVDVRLIATGSGEAESTAEYEAVGRLAAHGMLPAPYGNPRRK
jgi:glutamine phosphoribosylpyrophosphate amidotransferase